MRLALILAEKLIGTTNSTIKKAENSNLSNLGILSTAMQLLETLRDSVRGADRSRALGFLADGQQLTAQTIQSSIANMAVVCDDVMDVTVVKRHMGAAKRNA